MCAKTGHLVHVRPHPHQLLRQLPHHRIVEHHPHPRTRLGVTIVGRDVRALAAGQLRRHHRPHPRPHLPPFIRRCCPPPPQMLQLRQAYRHHPVPLRQHRIHLRRRRPRGSWARRRGARDRRPPPAVGESEAASAGESAWPEVGSTAGRDRGVVGVLGVVGHDAPPFPAASFASPQGLSSAPAAQRGRGEVVWP